MVGVLLVVGLLQVVAPRVALADALPLSVVSPPGSGRPLTGEPPVRGESTASSPSMTAGAAPRGLQFATETSLQPVAVVAKPRSAFDPSAAREVESLRTVNTKVFENADGTLVVQQSTMPLHFEVDKGVWAEIDNHVVRGDDGLLTNAANEWSVSSSSTRSRVAISTTTSIPTTL